MIQSSKHIAVILIVLLSTSFTISFADNIGGSSYSRYGLGDVRYFSTARSAGMGGAGIAVLSNQSIDRVNPAAWSRINRTRFSVNAMYEGFSSSDDNGSLRLGKTHFNGLSLAIPVEKDHGIVFSAGVAPYSKVNYHIVTPSTQGSLSYTLKYLGDGGLSLAHIGISGSIGNNFHLGTKLNYYFGSINHTVTQTFTTTDFTTAEVTRATRFSGIGMTVGGVYSGLKNMFNLDEGSSFNLAVVFSTTSNPTLTEERFSTFNSGTVIARDTITFPDGKVRIPFSVTAGLAYQSEKITVAADVAFQKWGDFTINGSALSDVRDSYRFGTGIELLPKKEPSAPFTQRIAYRVGFSYNASYYQIKGTSINEFGLTGGFGIPLFADTRLGIAAEYSFRGTTDLQLQKDRILRISLTLDIGELWFIHPPEE